MLLYVFNRSPGFPLFSTFFLVEKSALANPAPRYRPEEVCQFQTPQKAVRGKGYLYPV